MNAKFFVPFETAGWEGDVKRLHIDWRVTDDYPTREQAINAAILKALEYLTSLCYS